MPQSTKELIKLPAFVPIVHQDVEEGVKVKGFASVETVDRAEELVPSNEFNVDQFMASPTLLVNHQYWMDANGNRVAVGRPLSVFAAKLQKGKSEDNWDVVNVKTRDVITTYPKQKVPNLKAGDRGLFVEAIVTEPDVAERVRRGEYGSFSWRGLSTVDYVVKGDNTVQKVLKNIDLYEISLANVPENPDSTFIISKSVDTEEDLILSVVRLDKSRFESSGQASEYLKTHNLETDNVREDSEAFFALQRPQRDFDLGKLQSVKIAGGVTFICGPLKKREYAYEIVQNMGEEDASKVFSLFEVEAPKKEVETKTEYDFLSLFEQESIKMADEKTAPENNKGENTGGDTQVNEKQAKLMEDMSSSIASKTTEGMKPFFEKMTEGFKTLSDSFTEFVKASKSTETETNEDKEKKEKTKEKSSEEKTSEEKKEESKEETSKSISDLENSLNTIAQGLLDTQEKLVEVAKSVDTIGKATPETSERDEKTDVQKSTEKSGGDDRNQCFDSTFPFLG